MVKNSKEYMREYQKARRAKLKKKRIKPSLQSLQSKEVKSEINSTPKVIRDQIVITNGMRDQLKAFGKTVPFDDLQDAYMKLILYKQDLKYAVSNWLSTRKSKSSPQTDSTKKNMEEILEWLLKF